MNLINADYATFYIPSALMGLGIAIDVALATLARFRDKSMDWKSWTLPITLTHIIFPAFGYYTFWGLSELFHWLVLILGVVGFAIVFAFLWEVFCEWCGLPVRISMSDWLEEKFEKLNLTLPVLWASILAVSWDALFSGPAKAAQAQVANWTPFEVLISFFVAGAVVALVAQIALYTTTYINKLVELQWGGELRHQSKLVMFDIGGKFAEGSIIGGFGLLALWSGLTFGRDGDLYLSIVAAAVLFLILFVWQWQEIKAEAVADLK